MLPCSVIRSLQPRPATSPSPRNLCVPSVSAPGSSSSSASAFTFELSTSNRSIRKCPHQYHSKCFSFPLFSYSYALFCTEQNANSRILNHLRTLCTKHPGWRMPQSLTTQTVKPPDIPKLVCARVAAPIIAAPLKKSWFGTRDDLSSLQDLGCLASVGRLRSWMTQRAFGFRPRRDHSSNLSRVCKGLLP